MRPKAEAGVGDEEDLVAFDDVPARREGVRSVAVEHLVKVAVGEADAFDFVAAEFARAPGDLEAPFG